MTHKLKKCLSVPLTSTYSFSFTVLSSWSRISTLLLHNTMCPRRTVLHLIKTQSHEELKYHHFFLFLYILKLIRHRHRKKFFSTEEKVWDKAWNIFRSWKHRCKSWCFHKAPGVAVIGVAHAGFLFSGEWQGLSATWRWSLVPPTPIPSPTLPCLLQCWLLFLLKWNILEIFIKQLNNETKQKQIHSINPVGQNLLILEFLSAFLYLQYSLIHSIFISDRIIL